MRLATIFFSVLGTTSAAQAPCGGEFRTFVADLRAEAVASGADPAMAEQFFSGVSRDEATLRADRAQGIFQMPFVDFARRLISADRMQRGEANSVRYDATFDAISERWGVPRGVLLAFWAFETDFGAVQGDFNTVDSIVTLAHDCRRPDLFRPQVFAALELFSRGGLDPRRTTGAWAGEIGQVQMLPGDILENGVDGDGDGTVSLKTSAEDALMSGGSMLSALGWRPGEPWLQEVTLPPGFDLSQSGLDGARAGSDWAAMGVTPRAGDIRGDLTASVLLPQGRTGPAFLAYPNYEVLFEWNQSFVYVTTAAYFAARLEGAPVFAVSAPAVALSADEMTALQRKLSARGHDVGGFDGILGRLTREAVQAEQVRLGLPADAWPTRELLDRL